MTDRCRPRRATAPRSAGSNLARDWQTRAVQRAGYTIRPFLYPCYLYQPDFPRCFRLKLWQDPHPGLLLPAHQAGFEWPVYLWVCGDDAHAVMRQRTVLRVASRGPVALSLELCANGVSCARVTIAAHGCTSKNQRELLRQDLMPTFCWKRGGQVNLKAVNKHGAPGHGLPVCRRTAR